MAEDPNFPDDVYFIPEIVEFMEGIHKEHFDNDEQERYDLELDEESSTLHVIRFSTESVIKTWTLIEQDGVWSVSD